ncbi:hypothetical protein BDA96_10G040400 [Sorghum bicolor]|uniref:Uncharacterized protein n=2 Tax=Sorghum bicolor TaxID=4558 RepID=A0A921TZQ9_SORBI|nr:hypothetical protein BDA96_10G040400 [Sorghum bicolor]KXG19283.1 hypothetical protein SORBI_3010G035000 [Sorghum bicolor]
MERRAVTVNPVLVVLVLLVLSCLLVYPPSPPPPHHPYSSVAMPRSLRVGSQQQHPTALKLTSSQEMATAAINFEVDDYPPPDHKSITTTMARANEELE